MQQLFCLYTIVDILFGGVLFGNDLAGISNDHAVTGDVLIHKGIGGDHHIVTDLNATQNRGVQTDIYAITQTRGTGLFFHRSDRW